MKTKPMRLWAVAIGKKGPRRYVEYKPDRMSHDLAVYNFRQTALIVREYLLKKRGHKDVFVIPFSSEFTCPRLVKEKSDD